MLKGIPRWHIERTYTAGVNVREEAFYITAETLEEAVQIASSVTVTLPGIPFFAVQTKLVVTQVD